MEMNGIEPFSAIRRTDARRNELLRCSSVICSIPQKINFVKFILQKNLIFAKFDLLSLLQHENRVC